MSREFVLLKPQQGCQQVVPPGGKIALDFYPGGNFEACQVVHAINVPDVCVRILIRPKKVPAGWVPEDDYPDDEASAAAKEHQLALVPAWNLNPKPLEDPNASPSDLEATLDAMPALLALSGEQPQRGVYIRGSTGAFILLVRARWQGFVACMGVLGWLNT